MPGRAIIYKKKLDEMFEYYASKGCAVVKLSEVM